MAAGLLVLATVLVLGMSWVGIIPDIIPKTIPGTGPETTVMTRAVIVNDIGFDPYISEVTNTVIGSAVVAETVKTLWLEDTVTVKLIVYAPDGTTITSVKTVKVGELSETPVTFTWKTKQIGKHTVVVQLFNDKGEQISEKISYITV